MPTRIEIAKLDIDRLFREADRRVYTSRDLAAILSEHRSFWRLAKTMTAAQFVRFLVAESELRALELTSEEYRDRTLYAWGEVSAFEIGLALAQDGYLCHGSAVFLHALTDELPRRVYVNREQSPKPRGGGSLTQERLAAAFTRPQRESRHLFRLDGWSFLLLSGKHTGRLEVQKLEGPGGEALEVTGLERTLIDIAVRPTYAGGVHQVLEAYRAARDRASTNVLSRTLRRLEYVYPYHQAIGFYMERAGWESSSVELLRREPRELDFYLTHDMKEVSYDARWRLFFPKSLEAG